MSDSQDELKRFAAELVFGPTSRAPEGITYGDLALWVGAFFVSLIVCGIILWLRWRDQ